MSVPLVIDRPAPVTESADELPATPPVRTSRLTAPSWPRELVRRPIGAFGLATIAVILVTAVISALWTPHDPFYANPYRRLQPPSPEFLLGTDSLGRDVLSRLMAGSATALYVAIGSLVVAAIVGLVLAVLSSLTTVWLRESVAVIVDVLIAFPTLLIAMLLATTYGGSLLVVALSVGIASGVGISRIIKNEIVRVDSTDYVLAARAAGVGPVRIIVDHLVPNVGALFIVLLSTTAAFSILSEAGLSYLGYGAPSNTVSWGRMLTDAQVLITTSPEAVIAPGVAISLAVLGLTLFGDALREATDPRLKRGRVRARTEQPGKKVSRGA
ncbi:ABC transporter permease [Microbacterium saperdae]